MPTWSYQTQELGAFAFGIASQPDLLGTVRGEGLPQWAWKGKISLLGIQRALSEKQGCHRELRTCVFTSVRTCPVTLLTLSSHFSMTQGSLMNSLMGPHLKS